MKKKPVPSERAKKVADVIERFRNCNMLVHDSRNLPPIEEALFLGGALVVKFKDGTWTRFLPKYSDYAGEQVFQTECPRPEISMFHQEHRVYEQAFPDLSFYQLQEYKDYHNAMEEWKREQDSIKRAMDELEKRGFKITPPGEDDGAV